MWCLANHPNSTSVWIKFWLEWGQTNVLSDAGLLLPLLTPSKTIFHTVNRNILQEKSTSLKLEQMFKDSLQKQYQEFSNIQ